MIKSVEFKGGVKDVCAELEAEAKRCKGMTVGAYLRLLKVEKAEKQQFKDICKGVK